MRRAYRAGRRAVPAGDAIRFLGLVLVALPLAGCAHAPPPHDAWHLYLKTESAYLGCRAPNHRPPSSCEAEKRAYLAARSRYRAEAGSRRAPGR